MDVECERCPYCDSTRVTTHLAINAIRQTCDHCGKEWGDIAGHHKAVVQLANEERNNPRVFCGEGPPIVLLGVNPW